MAKGSDTPNVFAVEVPAVPGANDKRPQVFHTGGLNSTRESVEAEAMALAAAGEKVVRVWQLVSVVQAKTVGVVDRRRRTTER